MERTHGDLPRWLGVAVATVAASLAVGLAGLPTPALFGSLAVGIAYALTLAARRPLTAPAWVLLASQALIGVALGAGFETSTLTTIAGDWAPIALVTVTTVAISLVAGLVFAATTGVDRSTSLLGLVAGGASGIVAMSDELGADARLVAFMQYLRVLVVVVTAPLLAELVLVTVDDPAPAAAGGDTAGLAGVAGAGLPADLAFTAGCALVGVLIARRLKITAGTLLVPLSLAAGLAIAQLSGGARVPPLMQDMAFAGIGLQIGLRFTAATIREAGRLLPAVLLAIAGLIVACAGLAALLLALTDVSAPDAYLATTPGGLYAVVAVAAAAGGNATFVVAVQALRLFAMILTAPPLVRLLHRRRRR
ncbi:MAG: AbrB family transcriptional regulator [Actinomycetota bacterium]|nr:AbrB family transcriptional regulator [Solirubrobacterales bacterium]MDQ3371470.1 AbrB family transcriptional regulator [Actinomycetota bacterium]